MWSVVAKWLGGLLGAPFAQAAVDAYRARLEAGNNAERIAADLAAERARVDAERESIAGQITVVEQGRWYTAVVRPLFAAPFIAFNMKVIVWDKVLAWGATDALSPDMLRLESVIVASYFGALAVENAARLFRARSPQTAPCA
jgi:hypothetical protein